MDAKLLPLVENKDLLIGDGVPYAAILGLTPSRGARSPSLWNAAFAGMNISARMLPMDVSEGNFSSLIDYLKADRNFLGGAVTMPFKSKILPMLDSVDAGALAAGAVNCVYRKGQELVGTNTDGIAACGTLKAEYGKSIEGANILLLGVGGAGSAVAAYLSKEIGPTGKLTLANRSSGPAEALRSRLVARCPTEVASVWPVRSPNEVFDIIVNATSLGFENVKEDAQGWYTPKFYTPLGREPVSVRCSSRVEAERNYLAKAAEEVSQNVVDTLRFLESQKGAFVFDIIYQPRETLLMSLAKACGCRVLNGLPMNLEQAVIAFDTTTAASGLRKPDSAAVRKFMEAV